MPDEWTDKNGEPSWNWRIFEYRVKPEPKYRPYKDTAEMIEDFKQRFKMNVPSYEMPSIWIIDTFGYYGFINTLAPNAVAIGNLRLEFYELLKKYYYLDGTPVGKLVD